MTSTGRVCAGAGPEREHPGQVAPQLQPGRLHHRLRRIHPGHRDQATWWRSAPCTATRRAWGTTSIGTSAPADTWYLAEGSTGSRLRDLGAGAEPGGGRRHRGPHPDDLDRRAESRSALQDVSHPGQVPQDLPPERLTSPTSTSPPWWRPRAAWSAERAMYDGARTWGTCSIGATVSRRHLVPGGGLHRSRLRDLGAGAEPGGGRRHRGPDLPDLDRPAGRPAGRDHPGPAPAAPSTWVTTSPTTTSPPWSPPPEAWWWSGPCTGTGASGPPTPSATPLGNVIASEAKRSETKAPGDRGLSLQAQCFSSRGCLPPAILIGNDVGLRYNRNTVVTDMCRS